MRIFSIVDQQSDWYPKEAFDQFRRYSNMDFVTNPNHADLIWIFSYYAPIDSILAWPQKIRQHSGLFIKKHKTLTKIPVITTLHHLSPDKAHIWQPILNILKPITSTWHCPSPDNLGPVKEQLSSITHLPYWVDTKRFKPLPSWEKDALKKRYNLPGHRIIIGSFQRDTESDGVIPKLDKGPDIFCSVIEKLPRDKFHVLLTGPRRGYIEKRLSKSKIAFTSLGHVDANEINGLYNCLDYYLVTSRLEGGPQAILESAATRTKIFSTPVGISNLLSQNTIVHQPETFPNLLQKPYPDVLDEHHKMSQEHSAQNIIPKYVQYFASLAKKSHENIH